MNTQHPETIDIYGARENNLKNLSLTIPKHQITVFTGLSGSGKSSLCIDTIAANSRCELNETFPSFVQRFLPKYGRPDVDRIEHLPVTIVVDQKKATSNVRSTVGTYTDIYALLRLLFSRAGKPFVGYSDRFSFNHPLGRCERCDGLGEVTELDVHKLVDFDKSLNEEGCVNYIAFKPGGWRWRRYASSGLFDLDKKIRDYTPEELELFLYSPQIRLKDPPEDWPKTAKYEGLMTRMYRSIIQSDEGKRHKERLAPMTDTMVCPDCGGTRLNAAVRGCLLGGWNITQATAAPLPDVLEWLRAIREPLVEGITLSLIKRIQALMDIGLGYLTLDRSMATLSGGESQRCKIAKYINSTLSDMVYVLDEPSVGLHSHDIHLLKKSVRKLRDHGNTVLIVEHHKEMIQIADHIVDLGPGAGSEGGSILFEGSYERLLRSGTITGTMLQARRPIKPGCRPPAGWFHLSDLTFHNLKGLTVAFPLGVLAVIAGVAGAGKSSLMECFRKANPDTVIYIHQNNIGISLRSTPATYLGVAEDIRRHYTRATGAGGDMFTFNGRGGCPVCKGKGVIVSEMAFMDTIESVCEACDGMRYSDEALSYTVDGMTIAQVMNMTVRGAIDHYAGGKIADKLAQLDKVGLGYLRLNQALSTLSGGELQRVKLASYLGSRGQIFILDEPTDGLHPHDIQNLVALMDSLVDKGNSVFMIEHNLEVLKAADYVIEVGPGGGTMGGELLFSGTPRELLDCAGSVTGPYLRAELS